MDIRVIDLNNGNPILVGNYTTNTDTYISEGYSDKLNENICSLMVEFSNDSTLEDFVNSIRDFQEIVVEFIDFGEVTKRIKCRFWQYNLIFGIQTSLDSKTPFEKMEFFVDDHIYERVL